MVAIVVWLGLIAGIVLLVIALAYKRADAGADLDAGDGGAD